MKVAIILLFSMLTEIFCNSNEPEETFEETLIKNGEKIYSIIYLIIFLVSCIISGIIIFEKRTSPEKKLETSVDVPISEQNNNPNNQVKVENYDDFNILYALSYIGRIFFTIESLEVLFFLYNLFIQAILLIPGLLYDMTNIGWRNFFIILYFIFSLFSSNVLIIPSYEFSCFPFLRNYNPFSHLISFRYILNDEDYEKKFNKNNNHINLLFAIIGLIYFPLYLIGFKTQFFLNIKDVYEILILMSIFSYYISIILCYFLLSLKFMKDIFCFKPFKEWRLEHRIFLILNSYFKKRINSLPDIYLITRIVNQYLYKNYTMNESDVTQNQDDDTSKLSNIEKGDINTLDEKNYDQIKEKCNCKDNINRFFLYLKLIMIIFYPTGFWYIFQTDYKKDWTIIFFIIIYIIILILSFSINFPLYFLNQKLSGYIKKISNPLPFLISISITYLLSLFIFAAFFYITFIKSDLNEENFNRFKNLNYTTINGSSFYRRDKIVHSFCYSTVHNFPIYLYQTFINDAYYYKNAYSSFNSSDYKKLFFSDEYEIKVIGNLTDLDSKHDVKMIQYNVRNNRNNVTILSIKGTSYKRDIYLDAQLYLPSILLHILNVFSTLDQQKETFAFKFIEYGLSIPYRILFQYSIIKKYLDELFEVYNKKKMNFQKMLF